MIKMNSAREQGVGYFGGLIVTVSAWSIDTWFTLIGLLMGVITFLVGLYATRRRIANDNERAARDAALAAAELRLTQEREAREKTLFEIEVRIKEAELQGFKRKKSSELLAAGTKNMNSTLEN
jgi:energy-converting hydrogenase Eha subunit B